MSIPLYINGKFTAQNMTGVQRVAHELVTAIDRRLASAPGGAPSRVTLLCPPAGRPPALQRIAVRVVGRRDSALAAWEQFALPWAARDGWLLNLAGSAPWTAGPRSICVLHDAAVFDHPEAYTRAFRSWYRLLFRHLARRARGLVTVSEFSRRRLLRWLPEADARLRVVANGADHFERIAADDSLRRQFGLESQSYLLVVGTAKATKNVAAVIDAWHDLAGREGKSLVWVGGRNPRVFAAASGVVDAQTVAARRGEGVVRVGVVSDEKLKALYQHAAGLVVASTYEGFGFPAVEAMHCGCPVAAAEAASLPEICGDAALYFDPLRRDDLQRAMTALLHDAPLRAALAARGLARVRERPWDRVADELLELVDGWTGHAGAIA